MIDKKIFFYWSGSDISWMRYMTLYSFRKMNPDWEITLYLRQNDNKNKWKSPECQDFFNYCGDNYINKISDLDIKIKDVDISEYELIKTLNPVHQSDMFRYYMLHKEGGFYCDMDVLFFRPIDDFYESVKDYDTVIHESTHLTIGFLGCRKNNQFFKDIFECGLKNIKVDDYQSYGVDLIYQSYNSCRGNKIYDKIIAKYPTLKFYNMDDSLVYRFDWTQIKNNFSNPLGISHFSEKSIGYHWFGGSPISQKFNNLLDENNYKEYEITFTELLKNTKMI